MRQQFRLRFHLLSQNQRSRLRRYLRQIPPFLNSHHAVAVSVVVVVAVALVAVAAVSVSL